MVTVREAIARLVSFFRKDQRDREFDQELATHLEMATADHIREGLASPEARRRALARLGGIEPAKQLHRETRGLPLLDDLAQDIRYSSRTLVRSPAFTLASAGTLAIGIAATTAIFSTVNATLLRPLPYPAAEQLVDVHTRYVDGRMTSGLVATSEIVALRRVPGIAGAAGVNYTVLDGTWIRQDGTLTAVAIRRVTSRFFDVFGLPMTLGRAFTDEEHSGEPAVQPSATVVSHRTWMQQFGGDPSIIGKSVRVGEFSEPLLVIGVASPRLDFPAGTDFWVNARSSDLDASHTYNAVLRMRPGVTMAQLLSAGNIAMAELGKTVPQAVGREFLFQSLLSSIVGDLRSILLIVLGATALLLLLACVNVTNLSLAKGATQNDIRYKAVSEEAEPTFYLSQEQVTYSVRRLSVVVSTADQPADALIPQIRNALKAFDPSLAANFTSAETIVDGTLRRQQLGMTLMLVFGATALALAAIGLYGVIAYAASQRRGELATRIALGASGRHVFWMMMSGGQRLIAVGVALGLCVAYAAGRIVSRNVFAMRAEDPLVLLTAATVVGMVAWIATTIPALRASRQDPVSVLRD
ncbi:MAG TPA: ABC transporter permease [Vicinamibacterales bacterium]|jgi:ABC-type antimicrobial peptide transport system permease subunit